MIEPKEYSVRYLGIDHDGDGDARFRVLYYLGQDVEVRAEVACKPEAIPSDTEDEFTWAISQVTGIPENRLELTLGRLSGIQRWYKEV